MKDQKLESKEAFLPEREFGIANVAIRPVQFTQTVKLEVPKEVLSNIPLTLNFYSGKLSCFSIFAVFD